MIRMGIAARLGAVFTAAILAVACNSSGGGGGGNGGSDSAAELAESINAVNIAGAQGVVLTGSDGDADALGAASADEDLLEPNSVYKVLPDGTLERVPVEDDAGEELPRGSVQPVGVFDVSSRFVAMQFWVPGYRTDADHLWVRREDIVTYLVHKESGRAYNATDILPAQKVEILGEEGNADDPPMPVVAMDLVTIRESEDDRLYISSPDEDSMTEHLPWDRGTILTRIDITDVGNDPLQAEELPTFDEPVGRFELHANGDFMIYTSEPDYQGTAIRRVINLTGSGAASMLLDEIPGETWPNGEAVRPDNWIIRGLDGTLYISAAYDGMEEDLMPEERPDIRFYPMEGLSSDGQVIFGDYLEMTTLDAGTREPGEISAEGATWQVRNESGLIWWGGHVIQRHEIGGRILFLSNLDSGTPRIIEASPATQEIIIHSEYARGPIEDVTQVSVSENYIWMLGRSGGAAVDTVVRYNPAQDAIHTVSVDDLEMSRFEVMGSDRVLFEALRTSDAARVRGQISITGGEAVQIEEVNPFEPQIFALNPIRPVDFITIDGNPQEWPLDARVFSDDGDGPEGDNLTHYSEQIGNNRYYGLVEFEGDIDPHNWTVVLVSDTYEIQVTGEDARLVDGTSDEAHWFGDIGGRFAIGEAVEFFVPLEAMEFVDPAATWVRRYSGSGDQPNTSDLRDELP